MLALQIGLGIWIGGVLLAATTWTVCTFADKVKNNTRYGAPWWRGMIWAR